VTAVEVMGRELLKLTNLDQRPPCAHSSDSWMSEDRDERAAAAHRCTGCPLLTLCGQYAKEIHASFGVYGGRDRTPQPRRTT
jgi:Transcription factor WhiB